MQKRNLPPFLKADNLPKTGKIEVTPLGNLRWQDGNFGLKLSFDVKLGGKKYTWNTSPKSPHFRAAFNALCMRKKIEMERGEYDGNPSIQVVGAMDDQKAPF